MLVTELPIVTFFKESQLANAYSSMLSTPSPIVTDTNEL